MGVGLGGWRIALAVLCWRRRRALCHRRLKLRRLLRRRQCLHGCCCLRLHVLRVVKRLLLLRRGRRRRRRRLVLLLLLLLFLLLLLLLLVLLRVPLLLWWLVLRPWFWCPCRRRCRRFFWQEGAVQAVLAHFCAALLQSVDRPGTGLLQGGSDRGGVHEHGLRGGTGGAGAISLPMRRKRAHWLWPGCV